nr:HAD family hydrolase [uncultured Mediterraneibacter sp.]
MYDTCIFDLYGTLVDIRTDETKKEMWEKLALFYAFYGAHYTPEQLHESYNRLTKCLAIGKGGIRQDAHEAFPEIRIEEVFRTLFHEKGVNADEPLVRHAGQFFRVLSIEHLRLYEGAEEMLAALKESGRKIYLLSNAQKIFTEYEMNVLKITPYFDGIFISSEYGCKKPDLRFFEKLLHTFNIDRNRAVMIGNDGVCDIEGAKKAHLDTLYVRTDISPKEELPAANHIIETMDMGRIKEILLSH